MEIAKLEKWLEAHGWGYERSQGKLRVTNPHFGTKKEYSIPVVEESSLQNILLPHFIEGWHRTNRGEYLGPHHVRV